MINTYQTYLSQKEEIAPHIYSLYFSIENNQELTFTAGQYVILFVPQPDGQPARRLFSIVTPTTEKKQFQLIAEIIPGGVASEYFKKIHPGEKVMFQGPAGLFHLKDTDKDQIFLATGTGIAPVYCMLHELLNIQHKQSKAILFWGLRKHEDLYLLNELKQLANNNPNFQFHICLSRHDSLENIPEEDRAIFTLGRVTKGLEEKKVHTLYAMQHAIVYLCGNRDMVESMRHDCYARGVPKESVVFEKF